MSEPVLPGGEPILAFEGENRYLSNFFLSPVTMYGLEYPTLEHAFQAAKAEPGRTHDAVREAIRRAASREGTPSPGWAKQLGQRVKLRPGWDDFKYEAMEMLLRRKFEIAELAAKLSATYPAVLVEGNNWDDDLWGAVWTDSPGEREVWATRDGRMLAGANNLGKLLMKVREDLPPF